MTITIIKRVDPPKPKYKITCKHCTSELAYDQEDSLVYAEDRPCGMYKEYIICPVCEAEIVTKYK